ncbi:MAG: glutamine synthetase family protein [Alphaproteobacteria bacterium]
MIEIAEWMRDHRIDEVECLIADMSGVPRGKIIPAQKFLKLYQEQGLRIPETIFMQTVTGDYADESAVFSENSYDLMFLPDVKTMRLVPWYNQQVDAVAQVICDTRYLSGKQVEFSPRFVLKRILSLYEEMGLRPVVAPELEFYFLAKNINPDLPIKAPIGQNGRRESGRQAYGIDAANEFDPIIEDIYAFCEAANVDIDTMAHEAGPAQMEINFNHGDPLELADMVLIFKRIVRQAAIKHNIYATFMSKPHQHQPGSAMHIHQSLLDVKTGENVFATKSGKDSRQFMYYIGGLQRYLPAAMALLAPNVNSFRRIARYSDAPINVHWGQDNRTVGLRVPNSGASSRRVENRVPGADCNPYLAMAATLACGYLGLQEKILPGKPVMGDAYRYAFGLPRHQAEALHKLQYSKPLKEVLGELFVKAYIEVKNTEYDLYQQVISSWERENLLLNV